MSAPPFPDEHGWRCLPAWIGGAAFGGLLLTAAWLLVGVVNGAA